MTIPILLNHEAAKPIGVAEFQDGQMFVRFVDDVKITREMAFEIFGNAGLLVLESTEEDGVMLIRRGRIVEWSLSA